LVVGVLAGGAAWLVVLAAGEVWGVAALLEGRAVCWWPEVLPPQDAWLAGFCGRVRAERGVVRRRNGRQGQNDRDQGVRRRGNGRARRGRWVGPVGPGGGRREQGRGRVQVLGSTVWVGLPSPARPRSAGYSSARPAAPAGEGGRAAGSWQGRPLDQRRRPGGTAPIVRGGVTIGT